MPATAAAVRVCGGVGNLAEQVQRKSHYPGIGNSYFNIYVRIFYSIERINISPEDLGYIPWFCYLLSYVPLGKSLSLSFLIYEMGTIFILYGESYTVSQNLKST